MLISSDLRNRPFAPPTLGDVESDFLRVGDIGAKIGGNCVSPISIGIAIGNSVRTAAVSGMTLQSAF